jgi:hypothetical protein
MRRTIQGMFPSTQMNPIEMSAEAAIDREIAELGRWLSAQGIDPGDPRDRAHEGSRDRLYWRYGYFMGLKQALAMLSSRGEIVH